MNQRVITENFGDTWREVGPRLVRALVGRGLDRHAAEDVAQEVALRAVRDAIPFDDADDLARWAFVVGYRLAANHHRDHARERVGMVPDVPMTEQLEEVVSGRLAVTAVASAMSSMSERDRALLVNAQETAPTRAARVRLAVQRHRARQRLLTLVSGVLGWLGGVPLIRRLLRPVPTIAFAASLVVLFATLQVTRFGQETSPGAAPENAAASLTAASTSEPVATDATPISSVDRAPGAPAPRSARPVVPLDPLHGSMVEIPEPLDAGPESDVRVRPGRPDDRLFCAENYPVLGSFCTPF